MQFRGAKKTNVGINIAPLVDVIFLLVIFFAVSTTFLETAGLELELPTSSSTADREQRTLIVGLSADGKLYFDDEELTHDQLSQRLAAAIGESQQKAVVLQADTHAEHGSVVKLMDLIQAAGATGLTIDARNAGD